jgi:uncharacterized membrane protein YfcA
VTIAGLIGAAVMVIEFYYSFNPMPTGPLSIFVYVFAATAIASFVGSLIAHRVAPDWLRRVGQTEEPPADAVIPASSRAS